MFGANKQNSYMKKMVRQGLDADAAAGLAMASYPESIEAFNRSGMMGMFKPLFGPDAESRKMEARGMGEGFLNGRITNDEVARDIADRCFPKNAD